MAASATMKEADSFLPALTQSLSELNAQPTMPTAEFCRAMSLILPVFDHLGAPCRPLTFRRPHLTDRVSSSSALSPAATSRAAVLLIAVRALRCLAS